MKKNLNTFAATLGLCACAMAHDGRRFEIIQYPEGTLAAQGYISGTDPADDGGGIRRPYLNAIHGHWSNNPSITAASATLPGFDIFNPGQLAGHQLTAELVGASKWVGPDPSHGATNESDPPTLVALDPGEIIYVTYNIVTVTTNAPGSLTLRQNVPVGPLLDVDLAYDIAQHPSGVLYALEFILSSGNPEIEDSSSVYVILSPDGANHMERLHHAALRLESFLGLDPCDADYNRDGAVAVGDILDYLSAWASGTDERADTNNDGLFSVGDILDYLALWSAGCPNN